MKSDYTWIESLVMSYYYNRDRKDIINMIAGVINRITNTSYDSVMPGDDDTDILMGAIVIEYGEFGTSPRFGWIDEEHKENVLNILDELLEYHKEQLEHDN